MTPHELGNFVLAIVGMVCATVVVTTWLIVTKGGQR